MPLSFYLESFPVFGRCRFAVITSSCFYVLFCFGLLQSIIMLAVTAVRLLFKFVLDSEKDSETGQICGRFDSHDQATSTV